MSPQTRKLLQLSWPVMIESIAQMLMTLSDAYLVAKIGLSAISGVALAGNLIAIYQAIFIALSAAIASLVAKQQGQVARTRQISQAILLTVLFSLIMGVISTVAGYPLLSLLGARQEVTKVAYLYLLWVGGAIITLGLMSTLSAILRALGKPRQPMFVAILVNLLNVLLSAFFIMAIDLGVLGAALGTVLARFIGLLVLWAYLPFSITDFQFSLNHSKEMVTLALPSVGERLMMRGGDIIVLGVITSLGTRVLAGHAIGETWEKLFYLPVLSIATSTLILTAQAKSQDDWATINQIRLSSYKLSLATTGGLATIILLISPWLLPLYTSNQIASKASWIVLWASLIGLPLSVGTLVYTAIWQGLGQPKLPFYATTMGMWLIRICLSFVLVIHFKLGLLGVCIATIADNAFRFLILKLIYTYQHRSSS